MTDEAKKWRRWCTVRLVISMLAGVLIGRLFIPSVGNAADPSYQTAPLVYSIAGRHRRISGELFRRFIEQPMYDAKR